jgi:hypothetical protein
MIGQSNWIMTDSTRTELLRQTTCLWCNSRKPLVQLPCTCHAMGRCSFPSRPLRTFFPNLSLYFSLVHRSIRFRAISAVMSISQGSHDVRSIVENVGAFSVPHWRGR